MLNVALKTIVLAIYFYHMTINRPVVPGGAGSTMAPPNFCTSVNPISTRGADYATTGTPGFSDLPTTLIKY